LSGVYAASPRPAELGTPRVTDRCSLSPTAGGFFISISALHRRLTPMSFPQLFLTALAIYLIAIIPLAVDALSGIADRRTDP
jgi:hypothetical protein